MRRRRWPYVVVAALVALAVAGSLAWVTGLFPPAQSPPPLAARDPAPVSAAPVLEPATAAAKAVDLPEQRLRRLLDGPVFGGQPSALVVDVATSLELWAQDADLPRTPASLLKLVTAAAVLTSLNPEETLRTRVVRADAGRLVLVGGGDTTLTTRPSSDPEPPLASLTDLADATASALAIEGTTAVTLGIDDRLFSGPAVSPHWRKTYVATGVVSAVSALTVDAGRVRPGSDVREPDPAVATGRRFARLLRARGVQVTMPVSREVAPPDADEVAAVHSPTVAQLVELMLTTSDNDLAEALLRLAAVGRDRKGTFAEATSTAVQSLDELGVSTAGLRLLDGSGLARGSRVTPRALSELLVLAARDDGPVELDPLLTGLPVAGFSGTLGARFTDGPADAAAGLVRAKTGTLTGVSTLAGVTARNGSGVVFVVMADEVTGSTLDARAALDRFAAALARAGPPG